MARSYSHNNLRKRLGLTKSLLLVRAIDTIMARQMTNRLTGMQSSSSLYFINDRIGTQRTHYLNSCKNTEIVYKKLRSGIYASQSRH